MNNDTQYRFNCTINVPKMESRTLKACNGPTKSKMPKLNRIMKWSPIKWSDVRRFTVIVIMQ